MHTLFVVLCILGYLWAGAAAQEETNSSQCPAGSYTSKAACQSECEDVFFSIFTYSQCSLKSSKSMPCNLICGQRIYLWTTIGVLCVFAAAIATIIFTVPMCVATCASCLHSKKASAQSRRIYTENQQPNKEQQIQTYSYNPYAYWPYYGRQ